MFGAVRSASGGAEPLSHRNSCPEDGGGISNETLALPKIKIIRGKGNHLAYSAGLQRIIITRLVTHA